MPEAVAAAAAEAVVAVVDPAGAGLAAADARRP